MKTLNSSSCVRCGKTRIVLSVAEEVVGTSIITITETVCPDPDCQNKVNQMLAGEKEKRRISSLEKLAREASRKAGRRNDLVINN